MTFKGEVVFGIGGVDILYGNAALDAAEREAARLLGFLVAEHGDASMLVLQRRLEALEFRWFTLQRVQAHAAVRRPHHSHGIVLNMKYTSLCRSSGNFSTTAC